MDTFLDFGLDGDDEQIELLIICSCAYAVLMWMTGRLDFPQHIPRGIRDTERGVYLHQVLESSDTNCRNMCKMDKEVLFNLSSLLRSRDLLHDTQYVTVEEQLALFLHTMGHNVRNRMFGNNCIRSGETISRYFQLVLHAIGGIRGDYIRGPSVDVHEKISCDPKFSGYFKDCVEAIDGTHVHVTVPAAMVAPFYGRKPYPTQNVLAVVDFDLRFTYILAGWEGSTHDLTVLRDALQRPNGLRVLEGKFYLCDVGYNTRPGFLASYRAVRYHLSKINGRAPSSYKELYNYRHSSLRTTVERAFGSLKGTADGRKKRKAGTNIRWSDDASKYNGIFGGTNPEEVKESLHSLTANAVNERFGTQFRATHVINHLRTWRNRWNWICRLKKLSGCVIFVPETRTIEMPDEAVYNAYIAANKLDEPYLNKPIKYCDEMVLVFRGEAAAGTFSQDVNQPLDDTQDPSIVGEHPDAGRYSSQPVSTSVSQSSRGKGKRSNHQLEVLGRFDDGLQKIRDVVHEKKEEEKKVAAECYDCLRSMIGTTYDYFIFTDDVMSAAYDYIFENPKIGGGFLRKSNKERAHWLYRFMK